jgi:hypothetical protein
MSLLFLVALIVLAGWYLFAEPPTSQLGAPPPATRVATPAPSAPKTQVRVYINVTSGCQAETVDLLNSLGMDYTGKVDLQIIDFGSPEGEQRWRDDGLDCMALLFNGSPAVKFPGADGVVKTVTFFMPAGFSWTHDDLKEAFAAIKAGKLQVLTEDQARSEMEPRPVTLKVTTAKASGGTAVLINGVSALTIKAAAGGQSPAQRAQTLRDGLEKWAASPLHPSELSVATAAGDIVMMARSIKLVTVTPDDATSAGLGLPADVAHQWLNGLKKPVIAAMPPAAANATKP